MTLELQQLEFAMQALAAQHALLGDAANETALAPLRARRDALLAAASALVQRHHGKVLQYAGDSLLAAVSASGSHGDDPERAVHAGLALPASPCAWASTPAACCSAAGSTKVARSVAASPTS